MNSRLPSQSLLHCLSSSNSRLLLLLQEVYRCRLLPPFREIQAGKETRVVGLLRRNLFKINTEVLFSMNIEGKEEGNSVCLCVLLRMRSDMNESINNAT